MKLERIPVERPQESSLGEALGTSDDVHVEVRVALEVSQPPVQPLVEVLKVVPQASERLEINTC